MDDARTKYGSSSADSIPEPPPATRQYHQPPTPPQQQTATGYPPAMGYPPGYQHTYDQQYYQQPPPGVYYPPQHYGRRTEISTSGIFSTMMLFIFFTFSFSIVMWMIVRPRFPIFYVDSLAVTNFNVATDNFTSAWEVNLAVENRYIGVKVHLDRVQTFIYYNNEELLVSSSLETSLIELTVKSNEKATIDIKLSTSDAKQPVPPPNKQVMNEMRQKRKTGTVPFALKGFAWSQVRTGIFSSHAEHLQIRISCDDLKVQFEGNSGNGKLNGRSNDCVIEL